MAEPTVDLIREKRRAAVGQLLARGFKQREIAERLAEMDEKNPETGEAWTVMTISNDIKAIRAEWRKTANRSVEEHRARQLAELEELKRAGWAGDNHTLVLSALQHEAKLTDTSAPIRINLDLVSDLWDALAKQGRDPESVLRAMLKKLTEK